MAEPVTTTGAAAAAGWKALGLTGLLSTGVLGAVIIAMFDPPATRKELFFQALCAGVGSLLFGPIGVWALDYYTPWFDAVNATSLEAFQASAPVYFLIGALSWGVFGAVAKLRKILAEHGAKVLAKKAGLG